MNDKRDNNLTIFDVINCFSNGRGEFPRIFPEFVVMTDADDDMNLDYVYSFLQNAVYLGINGNPFVEQGLQFIEIVLKEATNLEVLLLDHWGKHTELLEPKFFDEFCAYLSSNNAFLSRFQLLKILSSIESNEFVVSRKNFNKLIMAYFAAPTNHVQKLHITHTVIKCSDISYECSPEIDQRYLAFKTLELDDCQFVTKYEATPQAISRWLGQGISELPQSDRRPNIPGAYFFKVEDKTSGVSRKRKHSD